MRQSTTPLILLPAAPSTDALAAGLGLRIALEKLGQAVTVASPKYTLPPGHGFLPNSNTIEPSLTSLRSFIVTVNTSRAKLDTLSYDVRDDRLHIYLAPKQGLFEPSDVTTSAGSFAHDLIITLDLPSLEALGAMYHDHTEFFYQVPVLNIDYHPANGRFGHVNVIDMVASSLSEITFELLRGLGVERLDERAATCLLTGIIAQTRGFQNQRVTPRSLAIASNLMSAGARRDDIVQHLYQTKTLPTLKLWGRALGRLQTAHDDRVVWTTISADDLETTHARPDDAVGVIDELMSEASKAEVICLFVDTPDGIVTHLSHQGPRPPDGLPPPLTAQGQQYYRGVLPGKLSEVAAATVAKLQPRTTPRS